MTGRWLSLDSCEACARTNRSRCHPPYHGPLFRSGFDPMRPRMAVAEFRQSLRAHELQALRGVVAVDFLHIELAHEIDGFLRDDLTGHHDREAGRILNHEIGRNRFAAALPP